MVLFINAYALTNAEIDMYNHEYYPESINNGGINQAPQVDDHDFYVSPATGNAMVNVTDIILPGKNGFDLEISRTYDSFQSNLYEPYVSESEGYEIVTYYMVSGEKDFEKTNISNEIIDFGYNNSVCINANYYNYTSDNAKYSNLSSFEYEADTYSVSDLFENYSDAFNLASSLNISNPDISATYPNQSVGYYWADYKNMTVIEIDVRVYVPVYGTGLLPDTSLERYSKLGSGWSFDFPYIE